MTYRVNTKEELEEFIPKAWSDINSYLDDQMKDFSAPFYTSVDIRESQTKFAPVDNNIYPAGFNNVCHLDLLICSEKFKKVIEKTHPGCKKIGLIPESHTKNLFYLDHLVTLKNTIEKAGYEVTVITPDESLFDGVDKLDLVSKSEWPLTVHKAVVENGRFKGDDKNFCMLLLNNDQSSPLPVSWDEIEDHVVPTPKIGWYKRQKIAHFTHYQMVANKFCEKFSINPDLLQARFKTVDNVDFASKEGLEQVGSAVDELLTGLPEDTSVFVKASQGTYGMGISVVKSGDEIANMNRKGRNKMDIGKNKIKFTKVLVQEGIETVIKYNDTPAEVTIYLINGESVGGFMRANPLKDSKGNLNARGMVYQKYCISEIRDNCDHKAKEAIYSVIGRLSTLASGYEIQDVLKGE
jgi:glutamate--cysteine ligase